MLCMGDEVIVRWVFSRTLQMLAAIENRMEELFELMETLPPEKIEAAEKVRETGLIIRTICTSHLSPSLPPSLLPPPPIFPPISSAGQGEGASYPSARGEAAGAETSSGGEVAESTGEGSG